jgi:hypothetical protein
MRNSNLNSVTFSASGNTSNDFRIYDCNLSTLDVSSFTFSGVFEVMRNSNLNSVTWGGFTTGLETEDISICELTQSEIDEVFTILDAFFTDGGANDPIKDLTVNVSGGTNSAPSATGTAAISSLQTKFTNNGFTFTATTN